MNLFVNCVAPTQSPQNARSIASGSTSVLIFWYPPTPFHQNGIIRNYTITYIATSVSVSVPVEITVLIGSSATFPLVTQSYLWIYYLKPYTNYTFSIYAVNDAGLSPGIIFFGRTYATGNLLTNRKLENYISFLIPSFHLPCLVKYNLIRRVMCRILYSGGDSPPPPPSTLSPPLSFLM